MSNLFEEAPPQIGDNSVDRKALLAYVERVENVESEIDDLKEDRKSIYEEAKSHGFDVKTMRKVVAIRKMDQAKRREAEEMLEFYLQSLGLL